MPIEIERKFLVEACPRSTSEPYEVAQGYLSEAGAPLELRVRTTLAGSTLTLKAGNGLVRTEIEVALSDEDLDTLWPLTVGRRVCKIRTEHLLDDGTVAYVDHFPNPGLVTVEVEFSDQPSAEAFRPPPWFGAEITGDPRYANAALAQ